MDKSFVHLHLHSEFSVLDGVIRIKELVNSVKAASMPAVAITDMANIYAAVKFYRACISNGIKPIIGADVWLENPDDPSQPDRIVLLCRDQGGYKTLCQLLTLGYQDASRSGKPCIPLDAVVRNSEAFIALSGAQDGELGKALTSGNIARARTLALTLQNAFDDRFYIELSRVGHAYEDEYLAGAVALAAERDLPVVASNQVHFLRKEDFDAHEVRVCIHQGRVFDDPRRPRYYTAQQYLRSADEMHVLFADLPEALENSVEIAKRCNVTLELSQTFLPAFPLKQSNTAEEQLASQSNQGLQRVLESLPGSDESVYRDRLAMELDVINQMGFAGYFLIVADFIRWSRDNDIPVGPGRGSGAGSLVAYTTGITDLDPIAQGLLFERFLNPERVSMPDFDIDFCMEGRDRVIEYVTEQYGRDKVAQIITFGTMAARAVVRDVGRVMGLSYGFVDGLAKLIPFEIGMTLDKALAQEEMLQDRYDNEDDVRQLIDTAQSLEGLARNVGRHAGGVVIAPTALTDYTALYVEPGMSQTVTHLDKDDLETIGLVKFDFLGLRTLTIIDKAIKFVNKEKRENNETEVDLAQLKTDDGKTYELVQTGKTTALFQLESRGMKELIQRLQPDGFDDLVALVALYRPGPLQSGMVDDFVDRKHGRSLVKYPHPDIESILKPTYGVILYQEQVMQIAQVLAGYTLGAADLLRRAMGKKKPEEMAHQREIFVNGAIERGVDNNTATYIFDLMEKFAGYGFNKSHSAAYALITFHTAWLKTYYPAAFMAAALSCDMEHTDKVVTLIAECRDMGLEILPPDVNRCHFEFIPSEDNKILYGMGAIKGVGQAALQALIDEREENGEYSDMHNICRRVDDKRVNKRVFEALVKAGAMDALWLTEENTNDVNRYQYRANLLAELPMALDTASQQSSDQAAGQSDLFGVSKPSIPVLQTTQVSAWKNETRLAAEKETLGLYLTGHPIEDFENDLEQIIDSRIAILNPAMDKSVVVAGLVVAMRVLNTRRGGKMAFITLDDQTGRIEISVFSDLFNEQRDNVRKDKMLVVCGQVSTDEFTGGFQMRAESIYEISQLRERFAVQLRLTLYQENLQDGEISRLQPLLGGFKGSCPVIIDYQRSDGIKASLNLAGSDNDTRNVTVTPKKKLLDGLTELFGKENVVLRYRRQDLFAMDKSYNTAMPKQAVNM